MANVFKDISVNIPSSQIFIAFRFGPIQHTVKSFKNVGVFSLQKYSMREKGWPPLHTQASGEVGDKEEKRERALGIGTMGPVGQQPSMLTQ